MVILKCCQCHRHKTQIKTLIRPNFFQANQIQERVVFPDTFQGKVGAVRHAVWTIVTEPKYNRTATIYAWLDQLFIFISIVGMIVETLPTVKSKINDNDILGSVSILCNCVIFQNHREQEILYICTCRKRGRFCFMLSCVQHVSLHWMSC